MTAFSSWRTKSPIEREGNDETAAMSMSKSEILRVWEAIHGELTSKWRTVFLADPRVARLSEMDPNVVRKAIASNHKLDAILEAARTSRSQGSSRSSRRVKRDRGSSRSRYSGGHYPHQPADRDLHKRIGPTQKYSDDF